ncbi:MAG: acyltransferase [Myxococcota bacterium]
MPTSSLAMAHWLATMKRWRRYFRYRVEGFEHLASHDCHVVVGYHGRPLAYDLFMLGAHVHDELGYLPVALVHRGFLRNAYLRWLTEGLEWATGRGPQLEDAVARGRHIIIAPGGDREGLRPGWVRYRVDWGDHLGYLRFAISRRLPIVPVAASGVDDAYFGLVDGHRLAGKSWLRQALPPWIGVGPLGPWPLSPPFPAKVHQVIGSPITPTEYGELSRDDRDGLLALHRDVQSRVQRLLDRARSATSSSSKRASHAKHSFHR